MKQKTLQRRQENGYETKSRLLNRADKIMTKNHSYYEENKESEIQMWALGNQGKDCGHRLGYTTEWNTQDTGQRETKTIRRMRATGGNNQGSGEISDRWHARKSKWPETRGWLLFKLKQEIHKTRTPKTRHPSPPCDSCQKCLLSTRTCFCIMTTGGCPKVKHWSVSVISERRLQLSSTAASTERRAQTWNKYWTTTSWLMSAINVTYSNTLMI